MLAVLTFCLLFVWAQAKDAGILYEVWHTMASQTMSQVKTRGGLQLTTEQVIQSNGRYTLNDVYQKYNLNGDIYNVQPELGFYCLFRKRPGTNAPIPDCPNITQTAETHAKMLLQAGFDYIAIDVTNWPHTDVYGPTDIAVLRPTEVLFEEWLALRKRGIGTPQITVWPCSPSGSNTWRYLLDTLYNNPAYDQLVWRLDGKKAVFLPYNPSCYDAGTVAQIQSNGGRNDVTTVPVWALFGAQTYTQGVWGFFSPCNDGGQYTTSMVGVGPCNQYPSLYPGSNNVMEITASGGYMLSQCSLPFASPGHMRGLTLSRLFEKVLDQQPPRLFMSSFNEHIGGRQPPAYPARIAFNMGLPNDPQRNNVWVDTYASEFSRDIEPSVEGGSRVWEVASSCVQLYKSGRNCQNSPNTPCCTRADKEVWSNAWSLTAGGADNLLTVDQNEKNILKREGWTEICHPIPYPSAFCVDTNNRDGRNGPFMLYNSPQNHTVPLYRCFQPTVSRHFISPASNCEGYKTESLMGWISSVRGGETLRALYRCLTSNGAHSHALDLPCDMHDTGVLGYVR